MVRIAFDVPEGVLGALHRDREAFIRELRVAAAVKWYESEQVSQGRAAEIAGVSRADRIPSAVDLLWDLRRAGLRLGDKVIREALARTTDEVWPWPCR